jgi:hypothetical protein
VSAHQSDHRDASRVLYSVCPVILSQRNYSGGLVSETAGSFHLCVVESACAAVSVLSARARVLTWSV